MLCVSFHVTAPLAPQISIYRVAFGFSLPFGLGCVCLELSTEIPQAGHGSIGACGNPATPRKPDFHLCGGFLSGRERRTLFGEKNVV